MAPRTFRVGCPSRPALAPAMLPATRGLAARTLLARLRPVRGPGTQGLLPDTGSRARAVSHLNLTQHCLLRPPAMFVMAVRNSPEVLGVSPDAICLGTLDATRCMVRGSSTPT